MKVSPYILNLGMSGVGHIPTEDDFKKSSPAIIIHKP